MRKCGFFKGIIDKELVTGYIIGSWFIFRVIRFRTLWDDSYYSWSIRIKFKWNVIE